MADELSTGRAGRSQILVFHADPVAREMLTNILSARNLQVRRASTADEARRLATEEAPAFAIVDLGTEGDAPDLLRTVCAPATNGHNGNGNGNGHNGHHAIRSRMPTAHVTNLKDVVDAYIAHVVLLCGGNRTRAARLLGISRETLRLRMHAGRRSTEPVGSATQA